MTDHAPVPGWLRGLGYAMVIAMVPLVVLGGHTTTRIAGMADPVWPTEPWYLVVNGHVFAQEPQPGFLLEHTHRAAGWITGILATAFGVSLWAIARRYRWAGLVAITALLVFYGAFHGAMMRIKNDPQAFGPSQAIPGIIAAISALVLIVIAIANARSGDRAGLTRLLASIGLAGVMIQGLLGGFRVLLNVWFGPDLAIVHGCFAHLVVATFIAALVFANRPNSILADADRKLIMPWILAALTLVLLQLVWGALTRHTGTALAQRLHLLTAFAATAAVLATFGMLLTRLRPHFTRHGVAILVLLFLQVALGVEAYLGKFVAVGPFAHLPPSQRPITDMQAITRTLHVFVGLALLSTLVSLMVHCSRRRSRSLESQALRPLNLNESLQPAAV
jgi:cytochrome c oxidase assembly protein subunit 15